MGVHYLTASKTERYNKINGDFIDLLQAKLKIDWGWLLNPMKINTIKFWLSELYCQIDLQDIELSDRNNIF